MRLVWTRPCRRPWILGWAGLLACDPSSAEPIAAAPTNYAYISNFFWREEVLPIFRDAPLTWPGWYRPWMNDRVWGEPFSEDREAVLPALLQGRLNDPRLHCDRALLRGDIAYIPRALHMEEELSHWTTDMAIDVFDVRDADAPRLLRTLTSPPQTTWTLRSNMILTDKALLISNPRTTPYDPPAVRERIEGSGDEEVYTYSYHVYDLTDPQAPRLASHIYAPHALAIGGWGAGPANTSLDLGQMFWSSAAGWRDLELTSGDLVISQHEQAPVVACESHEDCGTGIVCEQGRCAHDTAAAPYFLDRLDVSDPDAPIWLPSLNIPGQVVAFDADTRLLVTLDYAYEVDDRVGDSCPRRGGHEAEHLIRSEPPIVQCETLFRRAQLLRLTADGLQHIDSISLEAPGTQTLALAVSTSHLFFVSGPAEPADLRVSELTLFTLAWTGTGFTGTTRHTVPAFPWPDFYARGDAAFIAGQGVVTEFGPTFELNIAQDTWIEHRPATMP